jgi:hypothetical protein
MDLAPTILHYRLSLALAWAEVGCCQEAHELLESIALDDLRCPCAVARMQRLFERIGDHDRSSACRERLARMSDQGCRAVAPEQPDPFHTQQGELS